MSQTQLNQASGVNYDLIDPATVIAREQAAPTARHLARWGMQEISGCRGQSYYAVQLPNGDRLTQTIECLGTKSAVAQAMYEKTGNPRYFFGLGQDTLAMAANDVVTSGQPPQIMQPYHAAGHSDWFNDLARVTAIMEGYRAACDSIGCAWGGGETPALAGIVLPEEADMAVVVTSVMPAAWPYIDGSRLQSSDAIVFFPSSGIHANGLSTARKLAVKLPEGYLTRLPSGRTFGEVLLDPTHLYVNVVFDCLDAGIPIHYLANMTGHGWRKVMRHPKPFEYVIRAMPEVPEIFPFIQSGMELTDEQMFGSYNMGAGFACYLPQEYVEQVIAIAAARGLPGALYAGNVYDAKQSSVNIMPKQIVF